MLLGGSLCEGEAKDIRGWCLGNDCEVRIPEKIRGVIIQGEGGL